MTGHSISVSPLISIRGVQIPADLIKTATVTMEYDPYYLSMPDDTISIELMDVGENASQWIDNNHIIGGEIIKLSFDVVFDGVNTESKTMWAFVSEITSDDESVRIYGSTNASLVAKDKVGVTTLPCGSDANDVSTLIRNLLNRSPNTRVWDVIERIRPILPNGIHHNVSNLNLDGTESIGYVLMEIMRIFSTRMINNSVTQFTELPRKSYGIADESIKKFPSKIERPYSYNFIAVEGYGYEIDLRPSTDIEKHEVIMGLGIYYSLAGLQGGLELAQAVLGTVYNSYTNIWEVSVECMPSVEVGDIVTIRKSQYSEEVMTCRVAEVEHQYDGSLTTTLKLWEFTNGYEPM